MIIRKQFQMSNTHIVRNCYSERCKYSLHSHTAILECFWTNDSLDRAMMVLDFGLVSKIIKPILKVFDNSVLFWNKDNPEYIDFIKTTTDRWIQLPFSPSAEMLSLMFTYNFARITEDMKKHNIFVNDENTDDLFYFGSNYHETRTGYAETSEVELYIKFRNNKELKNALRFDSFIVGPALLSNEGESLLNVYSDVKIMKVETPEMQVPI